MVQDDQQMYTELNFHSGDDANSLVTAPAAGTALAVAVFIQDGKLEGLEISADEANWFKLLVHLAIAPFTVILRKAYRLNGDGQLIYKESFEKPILTVGASYAVTIQNVNVGTAGKQYGVSMKTWQRGSREELTPP